MIFFFLAFIHYQNLKGDFTREQMNTKSLKEIFAEVILSFVLSFARVADSHPVNNF